jgi:hypothetical protein
MACHWFEGTGRVASPRRLRFAMSGLGAPVRSEIGPYQALAERATRFQPSGAVFWLRLRGSMQAKAFIQWANQQN